MDESSRGRAGGAGFGGAEGSREAREKQQRQEKGIRDRKRVLATQRNLIAVTHQQLLIRTFRHFKSCKSRKGNFLILNSQSLLQNRLLEPTGECGILHLHAPQHLHGSMIGFKDSMSFSWHLYELQAC